jgi:hypothetical protein
VKLAIDTSAIAFLCAMAPEPLVDFETNRPRADENGEPLYVIELLAMGEDSADLVPGQGPLRQLTSRGSHHPLTTAQCAGTRF